MSTRSTAAEVRRRNEEAARLLARGYPRSEVVTLLAVQCKVDRRTARRYVLAGADLIADEIEPLDILAEITGSINRNKSLAAQAKQEGNLAVACQAEKTVGYVISSVYRSDNATMATMSGRSVAMPEFPPDKLRRKYREPISDPVTEAPF
jgi:hypothetical protein